MRKWIAAAVVASALTAPVPAHAAEPQSRYIVTLTKGAAGFSAHGLGGGRLVRDFRGFPGFVAEMSARQARRLATDPSVQHVEPDRKVSLTGTQRNPAWGLDRVDQRGKSPSKTYLPSADGDTVHAYVIDTGIRVGHRQFGGRAVYGHDFVGRDARADDCNGHGTHVAGTIGGSSYGVAKKVKLVAVRVLDCAGEGYVSEIIDGIDWVTRNADLPAVANMSLGGGYSRAMDRAVEDSIAAGITYVVAAGNEDANVRLSSPAHVSRAVTVAATDSRDRRASFSNYGAGVDLFAPGVDIKSATAESDTATAKYSGTSMAAPHVAGAAALILDAYPSYTPAQVQAKLIANATTGKVTGRAGSPNRLLYVPPPPKAPVIATGVAPTAEVGQPYSARLALAAGRRGGWRLDSGALPEGLSLSASGVISGTPREPGSFTVTVRFTDYVPQVVTRRVVIPVVAAPPVIDTEVLPDLMADSEFGQRLEVADGRDGIWVVAAGELPAGISLSMDGMLSGLFTGVVGATYTFTVRFSDVWSQSATRTYTLTAG
ncbi:S8 family peptidase [Actinoplanes sp. NEAU-A12]|uniref:S8 family peptidase n=1 Tax=Actinoplanes sandaracinus TaxID=3045177 RepID=A0ABT6WNI0_9ACTN|nr:S8 family peptidase [Actinoplanes sandaracinus]MDI6101225.1 S8 family peptidase [Actinoplanes sandaracinus]